MRRYVRPYYFFRPFRAIGQQRLYIFSKDEEHNYEIDFLPSWGNKLVPIEVKPSDNRTHKWLDVFCGKYSPRKA